jgi:hypothetical protein
VQEPVGLGPAGEDWRGRIASNLSAGSAKLAGPATAAAATGLGSGTATGTATPATLVTVKRRAVRKVAENCMFAGFERLKRLFRLGLWMVGCRRGSLLLLLLLRMMILHFSRYQCSLYS